MPKPMNPKVALKLLINSPSSYAFIDVRSPLEFEQGNLKGFVNLPILNNEERDSVGKTYKDFGQEIALQRGHKLTSDKRDGLTSNWNLEIQNSREKSGILTCWRGGLRSRIAAEWIEQYGHPQVFQIEGGMKALRHILLESIQTTPNFIVLTGYTGSGKTRLLQKITGVPKIDFENLANHRGSTFGRHHSSRQPTQTTFENSLALATLNLHDPPQDRDPFWVEDESLRIGDVSLPVNFKEQMRRSPVVVVDTPLEERVELIHEEYVRIPLQLGMDSHSLCVHLQGNIERIRRKLGGALATELNSKITTAFTSDEGMISSDAHKEWIKPLLVNYYDKLYDQAFKGQERPILFRGKYKECEQWIRKTYA